jgi:hypothetical protein
MRARHWAIAIGGVDCIAGAAAVAALFLSGSDPATKGFDVAAGWILALLLLITGVPALVLAGTGRAATTALTFALAFPVCFILLFIGAIITFAL